MPPITTVTPDTLAQQLKDKGLSALGLAGLVLSPAWTSGAAVAASDLDEAACTLTVTDPTAPFRALFQFIAGASAYSGPDGVPFTGTAGVLRLHPAAAMRLERLVAARYGAPGAASIVPVPWAMVARQPTPTPPTPFLQPQWYEAGDRLTGGTASANQLTGATVSFHDSRGLIIDPVAVAALLADLLAAFAALVVPNAGGAVGDPGGVQTIAGLAAGLRVHVVDAHGGAYAQAATQVGLNIVNGTTVVGPATTLFTLPDGQHLEPSPPAIGRLAYGWGGNDALHDTGDTPVAQLSPPALPTAAVPAGSAAPVLRRRFLRATVVDTRWFLIGNRGQAPVLGVPGDDGAIPPSLQPKVRDRTAITFLVDGVDTLASAGLVAARLFGKPGVTGLGFAISPALNAAVGVPPAVGAAGHWPVFPPPNSTADFAAHMASPVQGMTAVWSGASDVVVILPGGVLPDGAHVRLYPQHFMTIDSIGPEPSFVRGDGGAAIVNAANPVVVALANPFSLAANQAKPSPANLVVDVVITTRAGTRRSYSAATATVGSGPPPAATDSFAAPDALIAVPATQEAICPAPLFGLPRTVTPAGGTPTSILDLVRRLASESSPRQGPRLPTMGRLETVIATGVSAGGSTTALTWEAVLTGGRWQRETRSVDHRDGNPGNPAGPDVHAPGIHVDGALAYDLAAHSLKRAQPIFPLPGSGLPPTFGWLATVDGDNFAPPGAGLMTSTGVGAMLETVAAVCETPELTLPAIDLSPNTVTLQDVLNAIGTALGLGQPPKVNLGPGGDRLVDEVRREFFVARSGLRDAQWALHRAIAQARELVFIESAQFCRTIHPGGPAGPTGVDLVTALTDRLSANPALRVIIALPRFPDFDQAYGGWVRHAFDVRRLAIEAVRGAAPQRVVAFHPIGYPGRPGVIRTANVIVDDVWALVGATHIRRRGMTFDGSAAVAAFDRQFEDGYSKAVRTYRRARMAALLRVTPPANSSVDPSADWVRLGRPASAFDLVADLLAERGVGRIQPLWTGPLDDSVLPGSDDVADPDGTNGQDMLTVFAGLLAELPA